MARKREILTTRRGRERDRKRKIETPKIIDKYCGTPLRCSRVNRRRSRKNQRARGRFIVKWLHFFFFPPPETPHLSIVHPRERELSLISDLGSHSLRDNKIIRSTNTSGLTLHVLLRAPRRTGTEDRPTYIFSHNKLERRRGTSRRFSYDPIEVVRYFGRAFKVRKS